MRYLLKFSLPAGFLLVLLLTSHALANRGPHGGEMKRAQGIVSNLWIELVIQRKGDSKEIHAYGVRDGKDMNLTNSGYGGATLKVGAMEFPLDFYKVDEGNHVTNDPDRVEHYRAIAKFPENPEVEIEIKIAFPSKLGTGAATFKPYKN